MQSQVPVCQRTLLCSELENAFTAHPMVTIYGIL